MNRFAGPSPFTPKASQQASASHTAPAPAEAECAHREVPGHELFYLRTGQLLERHLLEIGKTARDISPSEVADLIDRSGLDLALYGASTCSRRRQDLWFAANLAQRCPTGLVTLSVCRNLYAGICHQQHFLVVYASGNGVCIRAYELRRYQAVRALEPVLHVEWWVEMEKALDRANPRWEASSGCFDEGYDQVSRHGNEEQNHLYEHRHPLEVEATLRFLAKDLLRRAGIHPETQSHKGATYPDRVKPAPEPLQDPAANLQRVGGETRSKIHHPTRLKYPNSGRSRRQDVASMMVKLSSMITALKRAKSAPPPSSRRAHTV